MLWPVGAARGELWESRVGQAWEGTGLASYTKQWFSVSMSRAALDLVPVLTLKNPFPAGGEPS